MSANNTLKINIPTIATKQLKLQSCNAGKKLVVSTNWLPLFGFEANAKIKEELIEIEMNFDAVGKTLESEIVGQSIETPMHEALTCKIK